MTKKETMQFIARVRAMYPASYSRQDKSDLQKVVAVWYETFKDFPNDVVVKALNMYTMQNDTAFGPSISQIYSLIKQQAPGDPIEDKYTAWDNVLSLLGSKEFHYDPNKAYAELPPITQKAVGNVRTMVQWSKMDVNRMEYIRKNFMDRYQELHNAEEERRALPEYTLEVLKLTEQKRLES